uniref:Uncharacterized protein n=1 Tax=Zymomonas mobilis TaxID=542 RepID=O50239_ZYMMB|nr:unknown [Zymomonas mobilis subsp. mobilis ZM4 = ATCC 31821]
MMKQLSPKPKRDWKKVEWKPKPPEEKISFTKRPEFSSLFGILFRPPKTSFTMNRFLPPNCQCCASKELRSGDRFGLAAAFPLLASRFVGSRFHCLDSCCRGFGCRPDFRSCGVTHCDYSGAGRLSLVDRGTVIFRQSYHSGRKRSEKTAMLCFIRLKLIRKKLNLNRLAPILWLR